MINDSKEIKMNNLNVFNQTYSPWRYPSNWIRNIRLFGRQFKWAYQRITRGFCDADVWDLDTHLSEYLAQTIEHLAKTSHSYPGTEEFPTYESWKTYLMEIANKFKYSLSELPNEYEDAWSKMYEEFDAEYGLFGKKLEEQAIKEKKPSIRAHFPSEIKKEWKTITENYLDKELENDKKKYATQLEALDMIKHCWGHLWD